MHPFPAFGEFFRLFGNERYTLRADESTVVVDVRMYNNIMYARAMEVRKQSAPATVKNRLPDEVASRCLIVQFFDLKSEN